MVDLMRAWYDSRWVFLLASASRSTVMETLKPFSMTWVLTYKMISTQNTHTHTLHDVFDDVGVAAAEIHRKSSEERDFFMWFHH